MLGLLIAGGVISLYASGRERVEAERKATEAKKEVEKRWLDINFNFNLMVKKLKERVYEILEVAPPGDLLSRVFVVFIMTLIITNVVAVMFETVESLSSQYRHFFVLFDVFSVAIFTIEYILRLWTITANEKYRRPILGRLRYAVTPLAIVDLVAILPFYIPAVLIDLRFVRVLRLFRIFRVFKLGRYSESLMTLGRVMRAKSAELAIVLFVIAVLMVFSSSLIYYAEHDAQPEAFPSIPASMWWAVITLTTIGYGDVYPITLLGKIFGAIIAILGIGMFALPAGILASGFSEEIRRKQIKEEVKRTCPYCGKDL